MHFSCMIIYTGEINSEDHNPDDDRETYFLLWKSLGLASQLSQYNDNNSSVESIIFGKPQNVIAIIVLIKPWYAH